MRPDQTRPEKLGMQILLNYCYYFYLCLLESMSFLLLSFYVTHTECIIIRLQHHVLYLFALFASFPRDHWGRSSRVEHGVFIRKCSILITICTFVHSLIHMQSWSWYENVVDYMVCRKYRKDFAIFQSPMWVYDYECRSLFHCWLDAGIHYLQVLVLFLRPQP